MQKITLWTDSESQQYKVFARPRTAEIQEPLGADGRRYVPSDENPADDMTQGKSLVEPAQSNRWQCGPSFLQQPAAEWLTSAANPAGRPPLHVPVPARGGSELRTVRSTSRPSFLPSLSLSPVHHKAVGLIRVGGPRRRNLTPYSPDTRPPCHTAADEGLWQHAPSCGPWPCICRNKKDAPDLRGRQARLRVGYKPPERSAGVAVKIGRGHEKRWGIVFKCLFVQWLSAVWLFVHCLLYFCLERLSSS